MKKNKQILATMLICIFAILCGACANEWKWVSQKKGEITEYAISNTWGNMETESEHGDYRGKIGLVKLSEEESKYALLTIQLDINLSDFDTEATKNQEFNLSVHQSGITVEHDILYFDPVYDGYPEKTQIITFQGKREPEHLELFDIEDYDINNINFIDVDEDINIFIYYYNADDERKRVDVNIIAEEIIRK